MNESRFDAALRAIHATAPEPSSLDNKVQLALDRRYRSRLVRRRVVVALSACAVAAFGLFAMPAVQASASLRGITSALDKAPRVVMDTYSVDENGNRIQVAQSVIADGEESYHEFSGRREQFTKGDKVYNFDPTLNVYIVSERQATMHLKLSEMLGPAGEFSLGKRSIIEHVVGGGRKLLRATVRNVGLPERYIIDADEITELPVTMRVESLERGSWRTREVLDFRYDPNAAVAGPDLRKYRVVTMAEASAEFIKAMERKTVAEYRYKRGRVVVRAVDVSQDGTVFVAYQAGDKSANSWRGYGMNVSDNLGTHYLRVGQSSSYMAGPFGTPDGKLELEVFTPSRALAPGVKRRVDVTTQVDPNGTFIRMIKAGINYGNGHIVYHWQPNYQTTVFGKEKIVPLLSMNISAPTCSTHPAWAETVDYQAFGNSISAEMSKAGQRGDAALEERRWNDAVAYFQEELRLMREYEQKGYGPWDQSHALDKLDQARSHHVVP
ncbi:MAG: hypothetical protein P4L46_20835 [Fimbriimonas sp.]|nr:hypothetical protein [Fimbriimonas sp.]